jgi:hypothetical protein
MVQVFELFEMAKMIGTCSEDGGKNFDARLPAARAWISLRKVVCLLGLLALILLINLGKYGFYLIR